MKTLEDMFREEHGNYSTIDVEAVMDSQSPVEKIFKENQPTLKPVPQSAYEKGLELAGIKLEDAAKFLEGLGSVNIGGIDFTLRDLLPIDEGVSSALKTAGSGMSLTSGKGMTTNLEPGFNKDLLNAGAEIALATVAAKPIEKSLKAIGKAIVKNKAKVATGAAALSASEASRVKYDSEGKRVK